MVFETFDGRIQENYRCLMAWISKVAQWKTTCEQRRRMIHENYTPKDVGDSWLYCSHVPC
ncbi:hypothetical protein DsansV1_C19g0159341 [Dioscorea sansibarensis]